MVKTIIIGGGLAGLGVGWKLREENAPADFFYRIFEKEDRPGGLCRTENSNGFLFDYTGHLLHFRTELFKEIVLSHLEDNIEQRQRNAWIFSKDVYTRYPFQAHLFGLPQDVIIECIYEFSKAAFSENNAPIITFDDWIHAYFGAGIGKHFMIPYNSKLYKRHPREMTPDCMGRFLPNSDLELLLKGAISNSSTGLGYNASFHYPVKGGIESLITGLAETVGGIHTNHGVKKIIPDSRTVITSQGEQAQYDVLVSTQPINQLILTIENLPETVKKAANDLTRVSILNVNLGVKGNIGYKHWVYVPEESFIFHRIGFPHNFSDYMAPNGYSSIYIEISYDPIKGIDRARTEEKTIEGLLKMGILQAPDTVVAKKVLDIPYGYVVFDRKRTDALKTINGYLNEKRIYSIGRFGSWHYTSMEDAFMEGVAAASEIIDRYRCGGEW